MIIPSDYDLQVRNEIKNILQRGNKYVLPKAEKAVSDQIKSFLKKRYDIDKIFIPINEFVLDRYYTEGEYCFWKEPEQDESEYKIYRCTFDCQGIDPIEEDFWVIDDFRNQLLVMYYIDLVLYHLYSSLASHKMPEHRNDRYQDALDWFKEVAENNIEADLPEKEINSPEDYNFRFNSFAKRDHRY